MTLTVQINKRKLSNYAHYSVDSEGLNNLLANFHAKLLKNSCIARAKAAGHALCCSVLCWKRDRENVRFHGCEAAPMIGLTILVVIG
jgi:hypothetical protein